MRWHGRRVTVYAYGPPVDMRKGFDGLSALVAHRLARDPVNGDVNLCLSRDRVRTTVLHWDGTGLCVYAKRLERGRFAALWRDDGEAPITLTISELDLFLDGSTLVGRHALAAPAVTQFSLAADRRPRSQLSSHIGRLADHYQARGGFVAMGGTRLPRSRVDPAPSLFPRRVTGGQAS